jgi:predicted PurR-regulated permease PerM
LSNFLGETELFVPLFILVPQRIYSAIINAILTLIFVVSFEENNFANFAISFVIIVSLVLVFLSFFVYQIQKKINQQQNRFRQRENQAMGRYLEKTTEPQKVEKLINSNFQKTRYSLKKKTFSYLPNLIIPGLNILFCFIYVAYFGTNWEIEEFVKVFLIAGSIQTIF